MIILRDYQLKAVQELREAIKDGAKNILLVAPTGSGKTVIAAHLIDESNKKFKHSVFVADRINLIDQTYDVFTGYGMRPGVIQSKHPKRDRQARIQIASAQTVSRRSWPKAELIVVDEAHTVYRTVRDRLMPRDTVAIGLTATPFTPGLGKLYDALVNVETTNNLIDGGFLSHYRIFAASAPDMEGVKIVAGEWDEAETSARAMPVVGDCVAEYVKHCQGKKFICSAVDTAHVDELVRQFTAAGIFVASYTYKDTDASRRVTVDEFRKPDSAVKGLVTVSAATKGFDVPDLGCVIMARPLRSSLAEHIQLFGRGLRAHPGKEEVIILDHCIATGQRVLTQRGLVPIQEILITDTLWDGHEFVSHKGVVSRGKKPVITYCGLTATADHPVKTDQGWRSLGECAEKQTPIVTTGAGRTAVRERENHFTTGRLAWLKGTALHACLVRVRRLWLSCHHRLQQLDRWAHQGLSLLQPAGAVPEMAVSAGSVHGAALPCADSQRILALRGTRDRIPLRVCDWLLSLDKRELGAALQCQGVGIGSDRQRWPLRAGQHPLGEQESELGQSACDEVVSADAPIQVGLSARSLCGYIIASLSRGWHVLRGYSAPLLIALPETEREVWDILACGHRNSFTCEGLLVHNSGNCERFWSQWQGFFASGASELSMARQRKSRKDAVDEVEFIKCRKCFHLHMPMPFCPACGFEYPKKQSVLHVPGTLSELVAYGNAPLTSKVLWPQIVAYARRHNPGKAEGYALALYRRITDQWPVTPFKETVPADIISPEVRNKILSFHIAWGASQRGGAA
jgi:hypothetical protein